MSSFFAVCHGLNDKCLHDFEKRMIISKLLGGGAAALPVATALNFETTFTEILYANGANLP